MSGNLIGLGMFVGLANWSEVWPSAAALVAFVAGVALGTRLNRRELRAAGPAGVRSLLALETVLLAVLAVTLLATPGHEARHAWPTVVLLICIGAAAMGLQAAALGKVGAVTVTTTYGTGSLVRLGQHLVRPARGVDVDRQVWAHVVVVLVALLGAYVLAAAVSAWAGGAAWLMLLPVAAMAAVSWWAGRQPVSRDPSP